MILQTSLRDLFAGRVEEAQKFVRERAAALLEKGDGTPARHETRAYLAGIAEQITIPLDE